MFIPPPENENARQDQFSEKPLAPVGRPASQSSSTPESDLPQTSAGDVVLSDELFNYILDCLEKGSTQKEVRKHLIAYGYTSEDANQAVQIVARWRRENTGVPSIAQGNAEGSNGTTNMMIGGGICLLGLVITIGTFAAASETGGRYTIAYGAIIWGAIQFFRGLSQSGQSQ